MSVLDKLKWFFCPHLVPLRCRLLVSPLYQRVFFFNFLVVIFLDSTCKWYHTVFVFLCLIFIFYGWVVFRVCVCVCVCVYHIFIRSSVDGHLGCVHILALGNRGAVNTGVHVSFSNQCFCFSQMYTQEWNCWAYVSSVFSFLRNLC